LNTGDDLERFLLADRKAAMGFGTPLTRYALIDDHQPRRKRYIVFTAHHTIYDGWTLPLIIERIEKACLNQPMKTASPYNHFIEHIMNLDRSNLANFWAKELQRVSESNSPSLPLPSYERKADTQAQLQINAIWPVNQAQDQQSFGRLGPFSCQVSFRRMI
jgi:hypothetical protein